MQAYGVVLYTPEATWLSASSWCAASCSSGLLTTTVAGSGAWNKRGWDRPKVAELVAAYVSARAGCLIAETWARSDVQTIKHAAATINRAVIIQLDGNNRNML